MVRPRGRKELTEAELAEIERRVADLRKYLNDLSREIRPGCPQGVQMGELVFDMSKRLEAITGRAPVWLRPAPSKARET